MFQQDEIILRDTSGSIVTRFDDWISYEVDRRVNDIDRAMLTINGNTDKALLFGLDYFVEFWRMNKEANIEKYREAVTLHRTFNNVYDASGQFTFESISVGLNDLLNRRIVYNYAGDARCTKSDAAETVMKEFVDEQAGPSATVALGRLAEGAITGLIIEPDAASGNTWDGSRAWQNLFTVLQGIGESKDMAFWVELLDPDTPSFIFRVKAKPYGADRSSTGIVAATGRNSAGNYPIVFSDQFGTAITPSYGIVRDTEANVAVVLGRGNEEERNVRERTLAGTTYDTDSPWNRREIAVHATLEITDDSLDEKGDEILETTIPQTIVDLEVVQHPSCLYGKDYFLGDIITVRVAGIEVNKTIIGVNIRAEGLQGQFSEQIKVTLGE